MAVSRWRVGDTERAGELAQGRSYGCRVTIIGAGYVGLVTGACLADLGHQAAFVEIDHARLAMLERGELPIHEPRLDELIARHRRSGRVSFTSSYQTALERAEFAFMAVPTPPCTDGRADTSFVFAAARSVLEYAPPELILVTKSTVPVGTGAAITKLAERMGRADVQVVSNPEFLREGCAVRDFMEPDRIVIGASDAAATTAVADLYAGLDTTVITCGLRSAELAKYAANALLATRISFMSEISAVC